MRRAKDQSGFSLIEVLAALGVMAAMMTIVLPGLASTLDRAGIYAARMTFTAEIQALRRRAYHQRTGIRVTSPGRDGLSIGLDEGWSYELATPIDIDAAGQCSGGSILLKHRRGRTTRLSLTAPHCREADQK